MFSNFELYFLLVMITTPAVVTSMIVGHRGGYAGRGIAMTWGRAWATTTKWFFLLAIASVGLLLAIGLLRGWNVDILGGLVPFASMSLLFLAALFLPITGVGAFIFHYFGARKRTREALVESSGTGPDHGS